MIRHFSSGAERNISQGSIISGLQKKHDGS